MKPVSDIRLRWYDDSSLLEDDPRKLVDLFLRSMGVSSEVASDILEAMLIAKAKDITLTGREITHNVGQLRQERGKDASHGLTDRNVQMWLRHLRDVKLIERIKNRYMFGKNNRPSRVFFEQTKPIIDETVAYIQRVLEKVEKAYDIG